MALVLQKWGNSNAIRLPKKVVEELKWQVNQKIDFSVTKDGLVLKPTNKLTIQELFADFEGQIIEDELDWGKPQGIEVW